jgi:hypothetical protein
MSMPEGHAVGPGVWRFKTEHCHESHDISEQIEYVYVILFMSRDVYTV